MAGTDDLVAMIRMLIAEQIGQIMHGRYGTVVAGSWDPAHGTVDVVDGLTATLQDGDVESPLIQKGVPIMTPYVGQQAGPVGGERVTMLPLYGGWVAMLHHGNDDAPQTPAGEWWAQRHDPNTPPSEQLSFVRIQNDGATRLGGQEKIAAISPRIEFGKENLASDNGVVRFEDLDQAKNDILQSVQDAFDDLASRVQGGPGVGSPRVADVTVNSSTITYTE